MTGLRASQMPNITRIHDRVYDKSHKASLMGFAGSVCGDLTLILSSQVWSSSVLSGQLCASLCAFCNGSAFMPQVRLLWLHEHLLCS